MIPEPSLSIVLEKYQRAIDICRTIQWEETSDYPSGRKTGIVSITPAINENGECTMLVGSVHDITERKKVDEENKRVSYLLNERVKELTTLYKVGQILQDETRPVEKVLQEIVNELPSGWQYPEITEARIRCGGTDYCTANFEPGPYIQTALFKMEDDSIGSIEILYKEARPEQAEGPFLAEERDLIDMIAEMIRIYLVRRNAMEKLVREKQLSESIINSLPGVFYLFDYSGKYLRWNKNHELISGYDAEDMRTMQPLDFIAEEEKKKIEEKIVEVFSGGYAEVESEFQTKDGRRIPFYFNGKQLVYEGRNCLMGVGFDITELRRVTKELQQAEIKFRTLAEKSQVGVYIVQKGSLIYVNPRFAEIFGYTTEELIGLNPSTAIISEEYQKLVNETVRARLEGNVDSVHYEVNGKRKDGSINRVEFYGSRTIYEGQPTIIGTMLDITERKISEEALQKSEANLQTIFDTTDTIYILLDNDFKVVSFNQRAKDFVKNELQETLSVNNNMIDYFKAERQTETIERMKSVLSGGRVNYESMYLQPDGSSHWYNVRMFPIMRPGDKAFGMILAVSDITEKKLLEKELLNQKVQEQKKMTRAVLNAQEIERNKIGQELHDNVNQILVGSKMYLGLIKPDKLHSEELLKKSITLLDSGINEIRVLSREQVTPQRKVDLRDLIQSLVDNITSHSAIAIDFIYEMETLFDDDLKLNIYRIIQEATNNILKHANAGTAYIHLRTISGAIHVIISDDGQGFSGTTSSKGIGISNILNRVESYNGHIAIASSPGNGCHIELSIPL